MQLDGALITMERRRMTACIDLAVVFIREHVAGVLAMTLCFAVPSCCLTWWLIGRSDAGLWVNLALFSAVSPFLGAVLVIAAGRRVFGDEFLVGPAFRECGKRLGILLMYLLAIRVLSGMLVCFLLPPLLLTVRYGFLAEVLYLEGTPRRKLGSRISNLMTGVFSDLVGRGLTALSFYCIMLFGLFVLVELCSTTLLGIPIVAGRVAEVSMIEDELSLLLLTDPRFNIVLHGLLWLLYPLIRLAWFFCYLDVRIQKEGWDVELDFRIEAQRLSTLA